MGCSSAAGSGPGHTAISAPGPSLHRQCRHHRSRHHASELYLDLLRIPEDCQCGEAGYLSIIAFTTIMFVLGFLFLKIPLAGLS